ncbi:hypothetical protein COCON_G00161130 [Conger conger]|uniref:Ubiquitin carboxyl-terminal hydrolase n=1 Tax=Conger conger TaxID=82655 RepID=A0A9Q1DA69_CONCO|nr:hypothetical protein COCON_G00161130 [Conger conger]
MPWCRPEGTDKLVREFLRTGSTVRNKMMKNWAVIGGIAATVAAGVYVLWGPITERKKRKKGMVPGLLNLGNTCFMNSLIQGLAACPSFITWLEEFSGQRDVNRSHTEQERDPKLSSTLLQLLRALSSQDPGEDDVLDAGCLLEVLRLHRWQISSFEEQDAHELFHVLTSALEEERDRMPRVTHLFDMQSLESPPGFSERNLSCRSRGPLYPITGPWKSQHPFHGRLTSNMICKRCEQQSPVRYDSFESLSLSIPAAPWGRPVTLDHCLQHFISSETIKEVECENCTKIQAGGVLNGQVMENQRTTFIKQLKLGKLPQCLCIHLQRLTWSSEGTPIKRQEHVQFTEYLSLDFYKHRVPSRGSQELSWVPKPVRPDGKAEPQEKTPPNGTDTEHCNNNKPLSNGACPSVLFHSPALSPQVSSAYDYSSTAYLFRLTAVLVHHGDMHSGHFVTYRRSPPLPRGPSPFSAQWLWVSDDSVRRASLQEALSSNAYLLFYERVRRPGFRPEE